MKAHLAKLSLALLSTVFLLGCQEQGSEPVGPEGPQFSHKTSHNPGGGDDGGDNPGSPFYEYTFAGDITTDPTTPGANSNTSTQDDVYLHSCCIDPKVVDLEELDLTKLLVNVQDADDCFGTGPFPGLKGIVWLSTNNQVVNEVEARFLFDAKDKDGIDSLRYYLTLDGTVTDSTDFDDGIFPPEVGETMTVTFTTFSIGAQRNKEKNACSHTGSPPGTTPTSVLLLGRVDDRDLEIIWP